MADPQHVQILRSGLEHWNAWRRANRAIRPDLRDASLAGVELNEAHLLGDGLDEDDLVGIDLVGADLSHADLSGSDLYRGDFRGARLDAANFTGARLGETQFRSADLSGANLRRAHLSGANFQEADLSGADLEGARLSRAILIGTNLNRAYLRRTYLVSALISEAALQETDFREARIGWTGFLNLDLGTVIGLDALVHEGPSTISIDTLYRTGAGNIPEEFLRSVGVPEVFVNYLPSLLGSALEFYSCFISFSSKDEEFAKRLHGDLQAKGLRVWFAPEDLKTGDRTRRVIHDTIRLYDKLLVILSENSVSSDWVEEEVETALQKERRERSTVLFPIRLDDAIMDSTKGWAETVRDRHIGDFRDWKHHDSYQKAFGRLLRDLKASETPRDREPADGADA